MASHFERATKRLKEQIIKLGQEVELQLKHAIEALVEHDLEKAESVIKGDDVIDNLEVELEENCLKLLALHQPVATDLRFVVAVLKINNDLERIGDLSVSISKRAKRLIELQEKNLPEQILQLADKAKLVLRQSLLALVEVDVEVARKVIEADDEIDDLNRQVYQARIEELKTAGDNAEVQVLFLSSSKHFERIGDLSSNIAEDVIYMMEGEIIRHGRYASLWGES